MGWHPPPHAGATAVAEQAPFWRVPARGPVPSAPADGLRVRAAPAALWPPRRASTAPAAGPLCHCHVLPRSLTFLPCSLIVFSRVSHHVLSSCSPIFSHSVLSSFLPCSLLAFSNGVLPYSLTFLPCSLVVSSRVLPCSLIVSPVFSHRFSRVHSFLPCPLMVFSCVFSCSLMVFSHVRSSFLPCSLIVFSHGVLLCYLVFSHGVLCFFMFSHGVLPCSLIISPMFSHRFPHVRSSFLPCSLIVFSHGVLLCYLVFSHGVLCFFMFSHCVLPCSLIVSPMFAHHFSRVHSSCSLMMSSRVLPCSLIISPVFAHRFSRVLA